MGNETQVEMGLQPSSSLVSEGDWYCAECDDFLSASRVNYDETCDTCSNPVTWIASVRLPGVQSDSPEASRLATQTWIVDVTVGRLPDGVTLSGTPRDAYDVVLTHYGRETNTDCEAVNGPEALLIVNSWRTSLWLRDRFIRFTFVWRDDEGKWPDKVGPTSWMTYAEFADAVKRGV